MADDGDGVETEAADAPRRPPNGATWVLGAVLVILLVAGIVTVVSGDRSSSEAGSGDQTASTTRSSATHSLPPGTPLPGGDALAEVFYKLADPMVPGDQKVGLVEGATPADAAQLDKLGKALQDSAANPLTVTAENIAWEEEQPGRVKADVTIESANTDYAFLGFPMTFAPAPGGGWQLTRTVYEILINPLYSTATPTPTG
jgi:hypothetical protein